MLEQQLIPIDQPLRWQSELKDLPHAPAHLWEYNQAMRHSSGLPTYLYVAKAANFKAVCPITVREKFGRKDIVTPYGFGGFIHIGQFPDFCAHWRRFMAEAGFVCGYVALHPLLSQEKELAHEDMHATSTVYALDLTQSLDALLNSSAKTHRYELRQWQQTPVELVTDKPRLSKALTALYHETLIRVNAASVYHFTNTTLFSLLDNDDCLAIGAAVDGEIEAISLFLHTPHIAEYFLNAASLTGRQHARGLLWAGIASLKQRHIPLLNLGGGAKPQDSLEAFKRRFGGVAHTCNVLKQVYDKPTFTELCQQSGMSMDSSSHYFPPYYAAK